MQSGSLALSLGQDAAWTLCCQRIGPVAVRPLGAIEEAELDQREQSDEAGAGKIATALSLATAITTAMIDPRTIGAAIKCPGRSRSCRRLTPTAAITHSHRNTARSLMAGMSWSGMVESAS